MLMNACISNSKFTCECHRKAVTSLVYYTCDNTIVIVVFLYHVSKANVLVSGVISFSVRCKIIAVIVEQVIFTV